MHFLLVYMHVRLWNEGLRLCTEMLVKSGIQKCYTHTHIHKSEQDLYLAHMHLLFIDSELWHNFDTEE